MFRHTNIKFIEADRTVSGNEIWEIDGRRFYLEPLRDGRYDATEINPKTGRTFGHTVIITAVMAETEPGSDIWDIVAFDGRLPDAE